MGPRAPQIHLGRASDSRLVSLNQEIFRLLHTFNDFLCQVLDEHSSVLVLLQLQLILRILRQQVPDVLLVNFTVGAANQKLSASVLEVDIFENAFKGSGNDTFAFRRVALSHHGVSLPASRLSVGEDGGVEALDHCFDERIR